MYIKRQQHFTSSRPRRPTPAPSSSSVLLMENSGEDLSSTASHSFSGDEGNAASEESGWTSYIDYFMETQQRRKEVSGAGEPSTDDAGRRCNSTSECSSDTGVGDSTWLPTIVEPSIVSRRLSLREGWRRKKVMYDDSLEDTATSPISSPKLFELRDSDATHHQKKVNSCDEIAHSKRKSTGSDVNGANTKLDTTIKEDSAYDNNELMRKKKGLCLVPMSAFHV